MSLSMMFALQTWVFPDLALGFGPLWKEDIRCLDQKTDPAVCMWGLCKHGESDVDSTVG